MKLSARSTRVSLLLILTVVAVLVAGCTAETTPPTNRTVPHQGDWGIYALDLSSEEVELIWSSDETISHLCLNHAGDEFAFSRKTGGTEDSNEEVFVIGIDGTGLRQLTTNNYRDLYPSYSPDDSKIAFLSWPGPTRNFKRV